MNDAEEKIHRLEYQLQQSERKSEVLSNLLKEVRNGWWIWSLL